MQKSGISDIDIMFEDMIQPLGDLADAAESIRKGLKDLSIKAGTYLLNENTIDDSITAILYALSSASKGDFDTIGLKVTEEVPYLEINKKKIPKFIHESIDAWMLLVNQLAKAEEKLNELPDELANFVNMCADYPDKGRGICEKAGMTMLDTARMVKLIKLNVGKINKGPNILVSAKNSLKEILDAAKSINQKIEGESLQKIYEIGKEIKAAKTKTMKNIVINHWHDKPRVNLQLELSKNGKPTRRN